MKVERVRFDKPSDRIILALDVSNSGEALALVQKYVGRVGGFKIGLELMMSVLMRLAMADEDWAMRTFRAWRNLVQGLRGQIFWDAKFNDIPNTVSAATSAVGASGYVRWVDVHASGGIEMLREAAHSKGQAKLLAVTALTSLSEVDCYHTFGDGVENVVVKFAQTAQEAGADGIVCSPREVRVIRAAVPTLFTVVPGTRTAGAEKHDQKRVMTPGEAVRAGADYLVIGRELTRATHPEDALRRIVGDIAAAEAAI